MQLLVRPYKNKVTELCIQCEKITLLILLLLHVHVNSVSAERTCHQCSGINCLRTSYEATQKCLNDLDICVTVFDGQTVQAQGCLEQISEDLRNKCVDNVGGTQTQDSEELSECFKCNENLCNNLASNSFECVQCDSDIDENCRTNPLSLLPSRCGISRTPNEYCFVKQEGNRVFRGCSKTLEEQKSCLSSDDCMICQPSELWGCNGIDMSNKDDSGSGDVDNGDGDGVNGDGTSGGENTGDGNTGTDTGVISKRMCHHCSGINCLRTSYEATQKCLNDLDICVTVYDGQTILAQGCLEQLSEELRNKCYDGGKTLQAQGSEKLSECVMCSENLCNNLASNTFECIQCDSESDENCRTNPQSLVPQRCGISRTPNEYCFVKQEGERVTRGCSNTLEEQRSCLTSIECMICQPSKLSGCNSIDINETESNGGSGNGSDTGSGNGSENGGSGSGGSDGGSGSGGSDGGSGNGSDSGSTGSGSGGSNGGSGNDSDTGSGSGSENGGSGSGGSDGGTGNGSDSGSTGSGSGGSNGGSGNGSDTGNGSGSENGGSGTDGSNGGSGNGSDNGSNGGNGSGNGGSGSDGGNTGNEGSNSGSGDGGSGSEADGSNGGGNSIISSHIFIINIIVVFIVTK